MTELAPPPSAAERPFRVGPSFERVPAARAGEVAAAIASLLRPPMANDPPPSWLFPTQVEPFRRSVAAIRRHGGAMLALPVGSGKTFVALGVAATLGPSALVVAPAILERQWRGVASQLDVPIRFTSQERISRGARLDGPGMVIVDESHRLREPRTHRYRTLAPDLIGRPVLLVTATPLVNRVADLTAQLLLAVRDDALRLHGSRSIDRALLATGAPSVALAQVVITSSGESPGLPAIHSRSAGDWSSDDRHLAPVLAAIDRLRLSRHRGVGALVRTSLYRALASSPAALLGSLRRYRRLLAHAADAGRAGHPINRAAIRGVVAGDPDQLVLWELLAAGEEPADLALGDAPALERLDRRVLRWLGDPDAKLGALARLTADGRPSLVFCSAIETVGYLRRRLPGPAVAWVTGDRAGVGNLPASRAAVLRWFDPASPEAHQRWAPRLLVASDVAAEGLNLQRIARVIHYDLPWTAVRLAQRDGRAVRLGSTEAEVEIVRFEIPPPIEARLEILATLERKAVLPTRVGLAGTTRDLLARDERLARRFAGPTAEGWTAAPGAIGAAAGFLLRGGSGLEVGLVLAREGAGPWTDDRLTIGRVLESTSTGAERTMTSSERHEILDSLAPSVAGRLAIALGDSLIGEPIPWRSLGVIRERLAAAHRNRDGLALARWEAVLRFLSRGHTAGEAMIASRVGDGDDEAIAMAERLGRWVAVDDSVTATLVGLVL